ncbi:uncharacterized protein LOC134202597 isoform X2 [Armigeres subalbatus]|uniref:uncharacterized protein LOC134202597 isoform X2 n=1 Tax=Armigeres subalbatus TaxID=124917 RepID=UPI002ED10F5B
MAAPANVNIEMYAALVDAATHSSELDTRGPAGLPASECLAQHGDAFSETHPFLLPSLAGVPALMLGSSSNFVPLQLMPPLLPVPRYEICGTYIYSVQSDRPVQSTVGCCGEQALRIDFQVHNWISRDTGNSCS